MKVIDFKKRLTNFTPGGNNFELKFLYQALENGDGVYRECEYVGMDVEPDKKLVTVHLREVLEEGMDAERICEE